MAKKSILLLAVFLSGCFWQYAADEQQELWTKAIAEKDVELRFNLLKEFESKFAEKKDLKNKAFLYMNLTNAAFQLKKYEETIQYGETALTLEGLDLNHKLNLFIFLANAYNVTKKDLEKALNYADTVVQLAKQIKALNQPNATQIDNQYTVPALRIQAKILCEQGKDDAAKMKLALEKSFAAFELNPDAKCTEMVFSYAVSLAEKDFKSVDDSIKAVELLSEKSQTPNPNYFKALIKWYNQKGDAQNTIKYYQKSYQLKKNSQSAYNIGVLFNKMNEKENAINFFAEAFLLEPSSEYSQKAEVTLKHLVYNEKTKGQKQEEQDKVYNEILEAAKFRITQQ